MGHLFSRAFRRITQCTTNQSRNQEQQQQQQNKERQDTDTSRPVIAQSIPVGQSIDSAEYAALETNNKNNSNNNKKKNNNNDSGKREAENKENKVDNETKDKSLGSDENNKQDVEEAVIKIQALVRGHLTRKALKDAHHHSLPTPNALGQSQFDEDSLTRNPPVSVFSASSPFNLVGRATHHEQKQPSTIAQNNNNNNNNRITNDQVCSNRSPLESIAEVSEITTTQKQPSSALNNNSSPSNHHYQQHNNNDNNNNKQNETSETDRRRKLSPLNTRSASTPSKMEMPSPQHDFTARSPTLTSEANASIDLYCETPASASIDILDHNIKPIDKMASVLHHKQPQQQQEHKESRKESPIPEEVRQEEKSAAEHETNEKTSPPIIQTSMTPDSLDSEEAAAIRIQSAFRGYRTRKNSPYRTRSPNSSGQAKRNALTRQQEATVLHDDLDDEAAGDQEKMTNPLSMEANEELETTQLAQSGERRESRARQREQSPVIQGAPSMEEVTTTEVTIREANKPTTNVLNTNRQSEITVGGDPSLSLDLTAGSSSEPVNNNTLDELGFSAALESAQTNMTTNQQDHQAFQDIALRAPTRNISGKESEASIELDTDSSVLGAALSLNSEDASELPQQQSTTSGPPNLEPIDELDKSIGFSLTDELESEARKLVEELNLSQQQEHEDEVLSRDQKTQQQKKIAEEVDEATHQLESVMEDATAVGMVESLLLDEEEQREIELESDDIERRDPRGYVSVDRQSKSPQIKTDEPRFTEANNDSNNKGGQLVMDDEEQAESAIVGAGLTVDSPLIEDGLSSPALNSSANVSSDEDNSDQENKNDNVADQRHHHQQQQQDRSPPGGKNKKRNRNKKKGRK